MINDEQRDTQTMENEFTYFAGMARGAKDERERIITLLRELRNHAQERNINTNVNINRIIEIIKGSGK